MPLVRPNILAAAGYIPGEQPADTKVVKLNTNENPYPPSPAVLQAITSVTPEQLRRYPNPSGRDFRIAAAKVHGLTPEHILTFNGGDELLSVAIRACAGEQDAVAFLEPSYSLYPVLTALQGARLSVVPYEISGTSWSLPSNIATTQAAILLIVNPNAPSGTFTPIGQLRDIARQFRGLLLIDEAYVDFARESALALVPDCPNILILRTMSKGYSLAGLRFGYGIGQPELLRELEKVRDSYPCDAIATAAAAAAIADQTYAKSTWDKVKTQRAKVSAALRTMDFSLPESHSNFVLAQAPEFGPSANTLYESLKSRHILVRWWDLPRISDKLRITIGTAEQNDRLLDELKKLLAKK